MVPAKHLVHIDADPEKIGRNYSTSLGLVGDAKAVLNELNFAMKRELDAGREETSLNIFDCSDLNSLKAKHASAKPEPASIGESYHPRDLIR